MSYLICASFLTHGYFWKNTGYAYGMLFLIFDAVDAR